MASITCDEPAWWLSTVITNSDLLVINKIDLADLVGANLSIMDSDTKRMRGEKPYVFSNLRTDIEGLNDIISFITREGMLKSHAEKMAG